MLGLRLPELLIILVVMVLLFGAKKLPELGESLGKGIRAFKHATEHGLAREDEPPSAASKDAASTPKSSGSEPRNERPV